MDTDLHRQLKEKIEYNARYMALDYNIDDIYVIEQDGYTIAFLSKYNPYHPLDENQEIILGEDGQPVTEWHYDIWVDINEAGIDPICKNDGEWGIAMQEISIDIRIKHDNLVMVTIPSGELVATKFCKTVLLKQIAECQYFQSLECNDI